MKHRFFLLFLVLAAQAYAQYSVGYYCGNNAAYPPSAIDYKCLTHIAHAFINAGKDGSISWDPRFSCPELIKTAHANGVKVVVSLGGWGNDSAFTPITSNIQARKKFIKSIVNFCKKYGYDGLDIDWEYPKSSDRKNFVSLVAELRSAFDSSGIEVIAMAIPSSDFHEGFDVAALKQYVTWFGVMTYDFTGSLDTVAYHNSPLYSSSRQAGSWDASMK